MYVDIEDTAGVGQLYFIHMYVSHCTQLLAPGNPVSGTRTRFSIGESIFL